MKYSKLNGARKEIVKQVVNATIEGGGDGWSTIICKYVDIKDTIDYIQKCLKDYNPPHSREWNCEKRERDYHIFDNQEAITVMTYEKYKLNPHKYRNSWDEVFVIL
jgi:hypothetical protein